MEHILDRELVALFSDEATLSFDEMLRLALVLPILCSAALATKNSRVEMASIPLTGVLARTSSGVAKALISLF